MTSHFERRSQPEAVARFGRARAADRRKPKITNLLEHPAVWSMSILTERMSTTDLAQFKRALADFAATRGLQMYAPGIVTCFIPTRGAITSTDRGAVLDWLCRSEKVHVVHILRRPRTLGEIGLTTFDAVEPAVPSRAIAEVQRVPDAPDGRLPDEDISQEPALYADEVSQEPPDDATRDRQQKVSEPAQSLRAAAQPGIQRLRRIKSAAKRSAGERAQEKRHGR